MPVAIHRSNRTIINFHSTVIRRLPRFRTVTFLAVRQHRHPPSFLTAPMLAPVLFDTHFRNTASNNWNLGIQREVPGNNVIDLAYVASEGHHIYRQIDGNPPDPSSG